MAENKRKNVLLISTDHWPGSLFPCEGRSDMITPTLDYLAENGVKFDNFYSECPVCIPARRTLMTGLTPKTHGDRVYSDRMEMPDVETLAGAFSKAGYQTMAVGKLHVYPQRNRIGFGDVVLMEEGRYEFGVTDDYQTWLGEQGYAGQEFMHGMGSNTYYTRPWHLPENTHPTSFATWQMMKQIKRRDPTRPSFFYLSYQFPHPPLVPLQIYLDKYKDVELMPNRTDEWGEEPIYDKMRAMAASYTEKEKRDAQIAFHAQCTHIDNCIRQVLGALREADILKDTIIVFMSDHGDMLFDHGMVAKRCFYEGSAYIPMIFTGTPMQEYVNKGYDHKLGSLKDVMPTLLDLCGIDIPDSVEGIPLFSEKKNDYIYGEISEGEKSNRMIRDDKYKLLYWPCGNVFQLFDMVNDRDEVHDLAKDPAYKEVLDNMKALLKKEIYGKDLEWLDENGEFVGFEPDMSPKKPDFGFYNQRGYHWPAPGSYSNIGKNA